MGERARITFEGMLVGENVLWESRHVPLTVCWIPGVVSFAVAIAPGAAVRNTLWKRCDWGQGERWGLFTYRTRCSAQCL